MTRTAGDRDRGPGRGGVDAARRGSGGAVAGRGAGRLVVAGLVTVLLALALGGLTRVPFGPSDGPGALLRLSWRARGQPVEECRRLGPEELARLPVHMRREEVCERRLAPYRLRVVVDGREVEASVVRASGARHDRPIYIFREIPLGPGEHRMEISFERVGAGERTSVGREAPEGGEDISGGRAPRTPDSLRLARRVILERGEVVLVTYDPQARELVVREGRP